MFNFLGFCFMKEMFLFRPSVELSFVWFYQEFNGEKLENGRKLFI